MVHRTEALLRGGFALLLFTDVTQASNSVPGTWWMCDGYLLSEAKNQKATRQASAEQAKQSLPPHTTLQLETWHFLCDTVVGLFLLLGVERDWPLRSLLALSVSHRKQEKEGDRHWS